MAIHSQIPCRDFNSVYTGKTSNFTRRITQHKKAIHTGDEGSSLYHHPQNHNYRLFLKKLELIIREDYLNKENFRISFH